MTELGRLRVIQSVGWYFPESSGGTEVYVEGLAGQLAHRGVESTVVAPVDGEESDDYDWHGIPVHRYPVPDATHTEIVEARPPRKFSLFADWLTAQHADIYHQHSWTRGCGLAHLRFAKRLGFRTVLTVHVPSVVCLRGTMMEEGRRPCDGRVEVARCTACWGGARGVPAPVAAWQARHPVASARFAHVAAPRALRTALATPRFVARRQKELTELTAAADRVIAVCGWLHAALGRNGVPAGQLALVAQGTDVRPVEVRSRTDGSKLLRFGFLGRWDPVKGIDILVKAFKALPADVGADLTVHALPGDAAYEQRVRRLAEGDPRIRFGPPLARDEVAAALALFDVLAVPSQWLETGPLVALEALAAGVPVLGSDLGGLAELVRPGSDGWLVPHDDVAAWTAAIAAGADRLAATRIRPVRRMCDVALDTLDVYRQLARAPLAC